MEQLLLSLCIGGLLGLAGQVIRVLVGIKKTYDNPDVTAKNFSEKFDSQRLVISLLIGFSAGMLASLMIGLVHYKNTIPSNETLAGLIAAGYSGADFIEGFIRKKMPVK
ncbi:MAG: hypothetical protein ACKV1O_07770 [Saprospiraceae bacterium]